MEGYKIYVKNKEDSLEAQELFFELGASWLYKKLGKKTFYTEGNIFLFCIDGVLGMGAIDDKDFFNKHPATKLTLPQLRDKVVLKRNDATDCTHWHITGQANLPYFLSSDEEWYFFGRNGWEISTNNQDFYNRLKPIEKEMKEYLDPENEYALITADDEIKGDSNWIEVPDGADCLLKFDDGLEFYRNNKAEYFSSDFKAWKGVGIHKVGSTVKAVWQRPASIDDEPCINHVQQTLNERQATYGSFEDVARTTEQIMESMSSVRPNGLKDLPHPHRMALYMIASKMSRIVNGDYNHKDSWHDIQGYARLVEDLL